MSIKLERLGHIMAIEISKVIMEEVKDENIRFVTINAVKISNDLSYAKVYFTTLYDDKKEEMLKTLNKASGFIRGKLFGKVEIRKMPELVFVYDESISYGKRIEEVIKNIKEEEE